MCVLSNILHVQDLIFEELEETLAPPKAMVAPAIIRPAPVVDPSSSSFPPLSTVNNTINESQVPQNTEIYVQMLNAKDGEKQIMPIQMKQAMIVNREPTVCWIEAEGHAMEECRVLHPELNIDHVNTQKERVKEGQEGRGEELHEDRPKIQQVKKFSTRFLSSGAEVCIENTDQEVHKKDAIGSEADGLEQSDGENNRQIVLAGEVQPIAIYPTTINEEGVTRRVDNEEQQQGDILGAMQGVLSDKQSPNIV
ncbi:hypothetical protein HAX54_022143 [Datura stramonium]|uniref:Uncharacterized protein n=1 Tax=Datura stramonium TaxID=4076 RepID=A0ABS8UVV1_DATST|nr:hypothetical protein [Datura stramonium]